MSHTTQNQAAESYFLYKISRLQPTLSVAKSLPKPPTLFLFPSSTGDLLIVPYNQWLPVCHQSPERMTSSVGTRSLYQWEHPLWAPRKDPPPWGSYLCLLRQQTFGSDPLNKGNKELPHHTSLFSDSSLNKTVQATTYRNEQQISNW